MSDRACNEATQSYMFRCPYDKQRRVLRLSDQDGSGVAAPRTASASPAGGGSRRTQL